LTGMWSDEQEVAAQAEAVGYCHWMPAVISFTA
jgi:hypothetical protein